MQTKAKSNSVITTKLGPDNNSIIFTVKDVGEIELSLALMSDENRQRAMIHGMTQRISDAAAISRNPETGKPADAADKFAAMKSLVVFYESGTKEWTRKRVEGGAGYSNGLLAECLKRLHPEKPAERIAAYLKGLKPSERAALLNSDKIRPIAEEIRAEAAEASKVDVDALLAGLDDEEAQSA